MSEDVPADRVSARDLTRRRQRRYAAPETGRHHHLGAAPERQPMLRDDGMEYVGTSPVQLAARTLAQLQQQRRQLADGMAAAAQDLRFEEAARLREDVAAVDAELARRSG